MIYSENVVKVLNFDDVFFISLSFKFYRGGMEKMEQDKTESKITKYLPFFIAFFWNKILTNSFLNIQI